MPSFDLLKLHTGPHYFLGLPVQYSKVKSEIVIGSDGFKIIDTLENQIVNQTSVTFDKILKIYGIESLNFGHMVPSSCYSLKIKCSTLELPEQVSKIKIFTRKKRVCREIYKSIQKKYQKLCDAKDEVLGINE